MKKKIIIFTSSGGAGHISATKALVSYLGNEYDIQTVFIFQDVFKKIDPCAVISLGKVKGEQVYNYFLHKKWYKLLNFFYIFGKWYFGLQSNTMTKLVKEYITKEKPDLVISVIPIVNGIILNACESTNVPFLLIPTDLDVRSFVNGINNPHYRRFKITLAFNDYHITRSIVSACIAPEHILFSGLPMRKDFFEPKDIAQLKQKYSISCNKPVIVLMMGGQGNTGILNFVQTLSELTLPAYLIVCTGKNTNIQASVQQMVFNPNLEVRALGFTEHISELLAIADLLITKSGSVSFCEGIYMNVPMILDATTTILYWERLNHLLLTEYQWGYCLSNIKKLPHLVRTLLTNPHMQHDITLRLMSFSKPRADKEIKKIIKTLLTN